MVSASSIKKETEDPVVRLDSSSLDDWLEHDLRASGILGTSSEPLVTVQTELLSEKESCPSSQQQQKLLGVPIATIFKAFATLTTIQEQQQQLQQQAILLTPTPSPAITTHKQGTKRTSSSNRSDEDHNDNDQADIKDEATVKRQRNTDAARRSRLRKAQKLEDLEHRVKELETMNGRLMLRVAVLETERDAARRKQVLQEVRVHELEAQLAEAHEALVRR